ncbi:hypothetical protein AMTRI_Chr03g49920 [Amborella trichopoda]
MSLKGYAFLDLFFLSVKFILISAKMHSGLLSGHFLRVFPPSFNLLCFLFVLAIVPQNKISKGPLIRAKMNDLMTKSFMNYVELKKQALKDLEAGPDIELSDLSLEDEENLGQFFEEVGAIKGDIEILYDLLRNLKDVDGEMKSVHDSNPLKFLRERMDLDMVSVLKRARAIKARLELLDRSNADNRRLYGYKEGGSVDRTRVSVTNGLRKKLRDIMKEFQSLREKIVAENREGLRRKVYAETGVLVRESLAEEMVYNGRMLQSLAEKAETQQHEVIERENAMKEIEKNLMELHQIFLDMAVLVEVQGEEIDNIEHNMVKAGAYVRDATKNLQVAKEYQSGRNKCRVIGGALLLVFVFVLLISTIVSLSTS